MRLRVLVPLLGLALLVLGAWRVTREAAPVDFPFWRLPDAEPVAEPAPTLGGEVLEGTVLGVEGLPLSGVLVAARQHERALWTHTDDSGRFELAELDAGPLDVSLLVKDYPPAVRRTVVGEGPVELRLEERHERSPELGRVDWRDLVGSVAQSEPGRFEGYEVSLTPTRPVEAVSAEVPRRTTVEQDGSFEVERLAPGTYRIALLPPWARGTSSPDLLTALGEPAGIVEHPRAATLAPLELSTVAGEIRGRVRDRRPLGARQQLDFVEGALVLVGPATEGLARGTAPEWWPPASSDREGAFVVPDLPPGAYHVTIVAGETRVEREVRVHPLATTDLDL